MDKQALIQSAAEEAAARYEGDPWDAIIAEWVKEPGEKCDQHGNPVARLISTPEMVTVTDILIHCMGKLPAALSQADQTRVARSLTAKGWKRKQKRIDGEQQWVYVQPVTSVTT